MSDLKIYKYPFEVQDNVEIKMPMGASILTVQVQDNNPYIWAIVWPDHPLELRRFRLFGTGHPIDMELKQLNKYIGTFQLLDGRFVGHLFETSGGK